MKRFLNILIVLLCTIDSGYAAREITSLDIAKWYLDSDLVLICTVNKINTIFVSRYDSISTDNVIFSYEIIREKYLISIDSIIKQEKPKLEILKTIETTDFVIIY